ncbi:ferrous iron transport protein B [Methermicoccus shengliensis]|uniref:Ferrous iron transport protein B n=1 Tax=Methermicoccus shengliensis TaxID=660064 RepID=A0A832RVG0_9EURY|nr:ferrous iron transport protein B [Methermicoccus shengliensis]KUK30299.1 MAG: Ferrous iron transport protein B [Methanosarcinales archeaon 56_1174]MDI3488130.1 ferrous iron transport protein [Methanosarcinales archaeon]HIH69219.1 ferrous iron transport protein B [Methermicoccus shengliensis]
MRPRVALIGNPNVGKTVVFNALTGARQRVGNWPGVTVERKEGRSFVDGKELDVIDLPGVYTMITRSIDERIAREFILEGNPDVVVDIVDASNLERNLYLTLQLLEVGANVVVALNKMDVARARGLEIDSDALSRMLGVPVVEMVATRGEGIERLKRAVLELARDKYGQEAHKAELVLGGDDVYELAHRRYELIGEILSQCVRQRDKGKWSTTEMLDRVLLHRYLGIPIFLVLMWGMFQFAFGVATPFMDAIDLFFTSLGSVLAAHIANEHLRSLLVDGIIGGLGFILVFVPNIFLLFFAISLMEDSGYIARAAFVMDRAMRRLGLHGKSFIPMLMGFGCNVPAIMATRTIESDRDRIITILVLPLMSCSARLPVYVLLAGAFFAHMAGTVIFSLYILGIVLAVLMALVFRKVLFRGEPSPFILELPSYQTPTLRSAVLKMWERGKLFITKAGTVLLLGALVMWFASTHPWGCSIEESYAAMVGHALAFVFAPLGFDWRGGVALLMGILAKEVVVGTFAVLYGVDEGTLAQTLSTAMTPLTAYAFMVFTLIYLPCIATVGVIKRELGSWRWALFATLWPMGLAYLSALVVVGAGHLLGFE